MVLNFEKKKTEERLEALFQGPHPAQPSRENILKLVWDAKKMEAAQESVPGSRYITVVVAQGDIKDGC